MLEEIQSIESGPVRTWLVAKPGDRAWSSARAHALGLPDPILSYDCSLTAEFPDCRMSLESRGEEDWIQRMRERLLRPAACSEAP